MSIRNIGFGILVASGFFISGPEIARAQAQTQGHHSYCQLAAGHLITARWMLQQELGDKPMTHNEKEALRTINTMIKEISDALPDRIKANDNPPKPKPGQDDAALIRQCITYLKKAKADLGHEEDSQFADGLRDRTSRNCDEAVKFVQRIKHN